MDWVVADLHGMLNTAKRLVDQILSRDSQPHFIFVGDYADRGPFSRELVDYLLNFPHPADFLRGNHDDVLDYLLNGRCFSDLGQFLGGAVNPSTVVRWWMFNGFASTMNSYRIPASVGPTGVYGAFDYTPVADAFRQVVPESHRRFYRKLKVFWNNETHFACHAYYWPDEELPHNFGQVPAVRATDVLWGSFAGSVTGLPTRTRWSKIGVFGHNGTKNYGSKTGISRSQIRLIDTGACHGASLTAYCCQTDEFLSVPAAVEDRGL